METKIRPVILAGGSGTRLWPLSRAKFPKQFITLIGNHSLFQEACLRFTSEDIFEKPIIVTNEEYRFLVLEQLKQINLEGIDIIIEPSSRNTAPASAVAAFFTLKKYGPFTPLLITPSDHLTADKEKLIDSIRTGLPYIMSGYVGVFGIQPSHPHTGYGYLVKGNKISEDVYAVGLFVEKPTKEKAEALINEQGALWNSGLYFANNSTIIEQIKIHEKELYNLTRVVVENLERKYDYLSIKKDLFEKVKNISIDKALGERSEKLIVIESGVSWSDLGSWSSLHKQFEKNGSGTIIRGDAIALNTENSYIESTNRLVAVYGLKGIGVIETKDAVSVFPLEESDSIKLLVQELERGAREETLTHKIVKRPWGEYEILDKKDNYQVKRLTVYPGGSSSLQRHKKRSEHWLVISGTASVLNGTEILELCPDDTTYIPVGSLHKIENKGDIPVTIIETQTGTYFGEDDIERLDDRYGRI